MLLKVYHIRVVHGTPEQPCTCSEDELKKAFELLPSKKSIANIIQKCCPKLPDAPTKVIYE